jgi:AAA domain
MLRARCGVNGFYGHDYDDDGNVIPDALSRLDDLRGKLLGSAELDIIPQPVPLIDGLLYSDSLAWLTGKRGCGKSFAALDMAGHVSLSLNWHGHATKGGPVLYIVAEGAAGLTQRVRAWEDHNGIMAVTFLPEAIRLPKDASTIGTIAADTGAVLVIIDTQARVTVGLDENSSRDMGQLVEALEVIREASGACVLPVHHEPRNGEHPRGHSTMDGAGTTLLRITKDGPLITLTNPKQKDAPEAQPVRLRLTPHLGSAVIGPITPVGLGNIRTDSETIVRETLLTLVGLKGGASYTELKTECGLPVSTFKYALNALVKRGEVRNVGSTKRTLYVLVTEDERPMEGQ